MRISDWSSDVCSSDLAAKRSHDTPGRKSEGDDRNSIVALGEARDRKSNGCIENGKSRAAKQAKLEVAECQVSLDQFLNDAEEIGRAHVLTPITNAHHVFLLLLDNKQNIPNTITS